MATGRVKKLLRDRGVGFIHGSDGVELFFHRSALQGEGFDALAEGQAVEFDVERGDKGPRAAHTKKERRQRLREGVRPHTLGGFAPDRGARPRATL